MLHKEDVRYHHHRSHKTDKSQITTKFKNPLTSDIPDQQKRLILQEIEKTFQNRLVDRWLFWDREKLIQTHPDHTLDYIDKLLPEKLSRGKRYYAGNDLKQMISSIKDCSMVKPTDVTRYISIGVKNVNRYLQKKSGQFHFIICDKGKSMEGIADSFREHTPILVINGIFTHGIAYLPTDVNYEVVIGFKKVAHNPFHDLVKFVTNQIPDTFASWIRDWRKNIDKIDSENSSSSRHKRPRSKDAIQKEDVATTLEPLCKKSRHNDNPDINSLKQPMNHTLPMLTKSDQELVLEKLKNLFEKDAQQQVSCKMVKLMRKSPKLSAYQIKVNLYMLLIHKEKYAGKDIIQYILNLSDECDPAVKQQSDYYSTGLECVCQFIRDGGRYDLVVVDSVAVDSISKNEDFHSLIKDTPVCVLDNLTVTTSPLVRLKEEGKVIGFKKIVRNIFTEFVELVASRIPKNSAPWVSLWKNEHSKTVVNALLNKLTEDVIPCEGAATTLGSAGVHGNTISPHDTVLNEENSPPDIEVNEENFEYWY